MKYAHTNNMSMYCGLVAIATISFTPMQPPPKTTSCSQQPLLLKLICDVLKLFLTANTVPPCVPPLVVGKARQNKHCVTEKTIAIFKSGSFTSSEVNTSDAIEIASTFLQTNALHLPQTVLCNEVTLPRANDNRSSLVQHRRCILRSVVRLRLA